MYRDTQISLSYVKSPPHHHHTIPVTVTLSGWEDHEESLVADVDENNEVVENHFLRLVVGSYFRPIIAIVGPNSTRITSSG